MRERIQVAERVGESVLEVLKRGSGRRFIVGLSGGSLASVLTVESTIDMSDWIFIFCDERCVPLDHQDSNYSSFVSLFEKWGVSSRQILTINPSLLKDPAQAAQEYQQRLQALGTDFVFDVLLLGLGPDGHTCSLFPGHALLQETTRMVAAITDSPKPPPCRITLTFPVLDRAKLCVFVACGASKGPVIRDILEGKDYPAARVKNAQWIIDTAAGSGIN